MSVGLPTAPRAEPASAADLPAVVAMVNAAYRGEAARAGWTHEGDLVAGQRTDVPQLEAVIGGPHPATLLVMRDRDGVAACALIEPVPGAGAVRFIGLLTVSPARQAQGLGRRMLAEAETWARRDGADLARMTVISVRHELIAWYGRRGYRPTGDTKPFPYGEPRVGIPLRHDLVFVVLEKDLRDPRSA